jgi:iron complex transport system ATP-binding protein
VVAQGPPRRIVTAALVARVFGLACRTIPCPETGTPLVVPADRRPALTKQGQQN